MNLQTPYLRDLKRRNKKFGYGTSAKALRMSRDVIEEAVKNIYSRIKELITVISSFDLIARPASRSREDAAHS